MSCACSKEASRRRQETQGIPMVLHCALRGRRLEGPRFVWDVPGSSPAVPSKSLIFPGVFAGSSIIVRFSEVGFLPRPPQREKACFSTVSEHSRDANGGGFFFERFIVDGPANVSPRHAIYTFRAIPNVPTSFLGPFW